MKTPSLLLALLLPLVGFAQEIVPGSESNVTVQLTETYTETVSSTEPTDTTNGVTIYRQKTERIITRDLLAALIEQGIIDDLPENAKNWRLVLVNRQPLLSYDGEIDLQFYAKRVVTRALPAIEPVLIPADVLRLELTEYGGESASIKSDLSGVVSDIGKFTQQAIVVYQNESLSEVTTLRGVAKGSFSSGPVKIGTETFTFAKIGAVTITSIVGEFENVEDSDDKALFTGSITFSAFKPVDIANYPAPLD